VWGERGYNEVQQMTQLHTLRLNFRGGIEHGGVRGGVVGKIN